MQADQGGGPGGARVLVVDPDPTARQETGRLLEQHGFEVDMAGSSLDVVGVLSRRAADLVVLEVALPPGEDGFELCSVLSTTPNAPAVIIHSRRSSDSERIRGLEAGADDFLPKPCNPQELLARVRAVLRRCSR